MKIILQWKDLFTVLFPKYCLDCGCVLLSSQSYLCKECKGNLQNLTIGSDEKKELNLLFSAYKIVDKTTSLLSFEKGNITQKLIHELKYKGKPEIGKWLGNWLGEEMKKSGLFSHIDLIIPVPLHKKRKKQRGYNQVSLFGKAIAECLETEYLEREFIRCKSGKSQTHKNKEERYISVKDSFLLKNTRSFVRRNILIVDDVVTTGSTLKACVETLSKANPKSINIATIVFVSNK